MQPPSNVRIAWEERFFATLSGLSISVREEPYPRPEAQGVTMAYRLTPPGAVKGRVVFAHATGNDSLFPQVELFLAWLECGLEVFTFDLDGHGRRSDTTLSLEGCSSMIPAAIHQACHDQPPLPLHGSGQSLGAALWLAAQEAQKSHAVTSLVLFSAPTRIHLGLRAALWEISSVLQRDFWRQRHFYGLSGLIPPLGPYKRGTYPIRFAAGSEKSPAGASPPGAHSTKLDYPTRIATLIRQLAVEKAASDVQVPCLLINGARDGIVPQGEAVALKQELPHCRLLQVPKACHYTTPFATEAVLASARWFMMGERSNV